MQIINRIEVVLFKLKEFIYYFVKISESKLRYATLYFIYFRS